MATYQSSLLKAAKPMSLKEAVLLAVRNNVSLQTAYLDRVLERFRLDYARSQFQPQGSLTINRTQQAQASAQHVAALDMALALPTGGRIQFGWDASQQGEHRGNAFNLQWVQPLLRGAGSTIGMANLHLAQLQQAQARLQLQGSVIATVSEVISAYRNLLDTRQQIVLANDALKRSKQLAQMNQTLVDTGRMAKLELLQTQAEIATGELDVIQAETNAERARLALLKLLDMDLLTDITPSDTLAQSMQEVALPSEAQALALAERLRPDYLAAQLALQASQLGLQTAQDQRLWQLDLVLAAQRRRAVDAAGSQRSNERSASLQLTIPINDRGSEFAASSAKIELQKAALHISDVRQALKVEVMNALRNLHNSQRQARLAAQNLQLNQQKPDNVIQFASESRLYIFDAKYRIQFDRDYTAQYGGPGPTTEDVNTMHRYRDANAIPHPMRPSEYLQGIVAGAIVLFPYPHEAIYRTHRFYKSIEQVEIGGLPFLPNATTLVAEKLHALLAAEYPDSASCTHGVPTVG